MPGFPRTPTCLAPRSHKSSHQPFLCLLFIPPFLPQLTQPSCCPGVLMRSYSNHNSCAHSHTQSRCKSRFSNPFPAKFLSRIPARLTPATTGMETRGLSPRNFSLRVRLDYAFLLPGCWGQLFVFDGEEGGGGGHRGRRKPFHANRSEHRLPSHMGDRSCGPGRSFAPRPLPAPQPGPAHNRHFAPNFRTGEDSAAFLFPPPGSPRSWLHPLPVSSPRLNETLSSFIYRVPSQPPRSLSYQCG